jgi:sRNA-binding protein
VDLDGNPAGTVDENGAIQARTMANKHAKTKQASSQS